uniref:RdRp n=1 Tax=viral metagenome TaxID=1070528 RepID=A0A8J9T1R5_9ZZZZ
MAPKKYYQRFNPQKSNLIKLNGPDPALAYHMEETFVVEPLKPVVHAMNTHLGYDKTTEILTNYRRSPCTIEALVTDTLSMDYPYSDYNFIDDQIYQDALKFVDYNFFPDYDKPLYPVHFCDLRAYPYDMSVSACEPFISSPELKNLLKEAQQHGDLRHAHPTFGNLYNDIFVRTRKELHEIKDNVDNCANTMKYVYDIRAFPRSHLVKKEDPDKLRQVYGCPKNHILSETMFYWPLFDYYKQHPDNHILAWGKETLSGGWNKILAEMPVKLSPQYTVLCIDFKKFDKRLNFRLIDDAHKLFKAHIDFSQYVPVWSSYDDAEYGPPEDREKQKVRMTRLFDWMCRTVKDAPVRLPDGSRYQRTKSGMPSGIFGTNWTDSICNAIYVYCILRDMSIPIHNDTYMKVMGDDSLVVLPFDVDILGSEQEAKEALAYHAKKRFGAVVNTAKGKSVVSGNIQDVPFLGFYNNSGYPSRDMEELYARLVYPERASDYNVLMARCIGHAYASCGLDRTFYTVVKDIFEYLQGQGFSPSTKELRNFDFMHGFHLTQSFPTMDEITKRLTPDTHPPDNSEYMPGWLFKHDEMPWRTCRRIRTYRDVYPNFC